jgi:hypothetical protein
VRKTTETEHQLKLAIRDILAHDPLTSVQKLQRDLKTRGFKTANDNTLDWHYVSKIVRKLSREASLAVDQQKIQDRLAITKERYRVLVERLWRIIDYKWEYLEQFGLYPPKTDEIIKAINTLVKLDLAILKAEMDAGIFERKLGSVDLNVYRAAPLDPEKAIQIAEAFKRWGIDLNLPTQRPKLIESSPVHAPADHPPAATNG